MVVSLLELNATPHMAGEIVSTFVPLGPKPQAQIRLKKTEYHYVLEPFVVVMNEKYQGYVIASHDSNSHTLLW